MDTVGYTRVSTTDQNLCVQLPFLQAVRYKKSGRQQHDACLDCLREGETLIAPRIDRLSRSLRHLQNLVHKLKEQDIYLKATEQPTDTSRASGMVFFEFVGFETNLRREGRLVGIASAKKEEKYKGRQPIEKVKINEVF